MELSKLEIALLSVPIEVACVLISHGADQAFQYTGVEPDDRAAFFFDQGQQAARRADAAWEKELRNRVTDGDGP